ncbi:hypothetical protein, partial [Shewanella chilikensis]|uniref:hypothetical protein n=1 Tax=Shewanella chilikensis TaxID=558541 RepID=UPI003005622A
EKPNWLPTFPDSLKLFAIRNAAPSPNNQDHFESSEANQKRGKWSLKVQELMLTQPVEFKE